MKIAKEAGIVWSRRLRNGGAVEAPRNGSVFIASIVLVLVQTFRWASDQIALQSAGYALATPQTARAVMQAKTTAVEAAKSAFFDFWTNWSRRAMGLVLNLPVMAQQGCLFHQCEWARINSRHVMLVQTQLHRQFVAHFHGNHFHKPYRRWDGRG